MTANAMLLKEIESMPEEFAAKLLDFAIFIKRQHLLTKTPNKIDIKDAHGIFKDLKGMDTSIERDEEDRI